jgi:hypothetical protein
LKWSTVSRTNSIACDAWPAKIVLAAGTAVRALASEEYRTLSSTYLEGFDTWSEVIKPPELVRGEAIAGSSRPRFAIGSRTT